MIPAELDPELWRSRPGLTPILSALGGDRGETRLVGGAVRDWLLALPVNDVDLATRLHPHETIARLEAAGLKAVPTGLKHGTVTAVASGVGHEVTTLRRDVTTFGRHAEIAFTDDWQADAARRDFTINALYADPATGALYDWFGGLSDLAARHVRFIGVPETRIAEDHLRILRFFRFSARFSDRIDPAGLAACAARANDLMALSRERIRDELLKLLALPAPVATLAAMLEHAILRPVLPEIDADGLRRLERLIASEADADVAANAIRRLSALLPSNPALAVDIAGRLRLSKQDRARLIAAADRTAVAGDPRQTAYAIGGMATLDRLLLGEDVRAKSWAKPLQTWHNPRLPISGKDLIAMGLPPGPAVSQRLHQVEQRWIAAGFPSARAETLAIARDVLGIR